MRTLVVFEAPSLAWPFLNRALTTAHPPPILHGKGSANKLLISLFIYLLIYYNLVLEVQRLRRPAATQWLNFGFIASSLACRCHGLRRVAVYSRAALGHRSPRPRPRPIPIPPAISHITRHRRGSRRSQILPCQSSLGQERVLQTMSLILYLRRAADSPRPGMAVPQLMSVDVQQTSEVSEYHVVAVMPDGVTLDLLADAR